MNSAPATNRTALALAVAAALVACAGPVRASAGIDDTGLSQADTGLSQAAALAQAAQVTQTLYLDIVLDGRVVRPLVRFTRRDGRLFVDPQELELAGLELPSGLPLDADGRVALDAVPGLQAQYDQPLQRAILVAGPELRPTQHLGYRPPDPVQVRRDHGLVLDWDAYARDFADSQTWSLGTGVRWFGRFGALETTGVSRFGDGEDKAYRRLNTTWSWSDPVRMQTWSAGDLVSGGFGWTRPVRIGGLQWRRNFGVRPDLIVYPLPQFSADATLPSSVELYVNNVRQYEQDVEPGPFILNNFPRMIGAGQAVVVVTDALGRRTQTTVPLYVDYQRLAPGLSDFSIEAGVLRRGLGTVDDAYGDDPVASGSWRRGLDSDLTVELHGELGPDLRLGGAGLAWSPLGRYGVVTASYARSAGAGAGNQYSLGYQWFGQDFGFDVQHQRGDAAYRDLGTLGGGSAPLREQDRASLWFSVPRGSLSLSWLRYRDGEDFASRTISLGLNQSYGRVAVSANAFDDQRTGLGLSLSVSVPFGDGLDASFNADRDGGGETRYAASVRQGAPYAGGWGWEAQARDDGSGQLSTRWRGRGGEFWLGVDRVNERHGSFAQGNGSVVLMDGQAFASRRIGDSFAVVSTNGIGDVPILYENRVAGSTNEDGYLLLADLRGWQDNRIAIDPDRLPADLDVPKIERLVTPADRAGVRVEFEIERIRSAIVLLHDVNGQPVAAGTRVRRADGGDAIVGFGGELYLEDYIDGEELRWSRAGDRCTARTPVLPDGRPMPTLGPVGCRLQGVE